VSDVAQGPRVQEAVVQKSYNKDFLCKSLKHILELLTLFFYTVIIIAEKPHKKKFRKEDRHSSRISIPLEIYTTEEYRKGPVFSYSSENIILACESMKERMIDIISDSSFSLCRCLSKEVFGTETHYELIRNLLVDNIRDAETGIYTDLIESELNALKQKGTSVEAKGGMSSCIDLITDGIEMPGLQLQAAANLFQCSIYVINVADDNEKMLCFWEETKPTKHKGGGIPEYRENRCKGEYYITLYKTFSGLFYRVAPKWEVCNCSCLTKPAVPGEEMVHSNIPGKTYNYTL
jgi:hypothetical protein